MPYFEIGGEPSPFPSREGGGLGWGVVGHLGGPGIMSVVTSVKTVGLKKLPPSFILIRGALASEATFIAGGLGEALREPFQCGVFNMMNCALLPNFSAEFLDRARALIINDAFAGPISRYSLPAHARLAPTGRR